MVVIKIHFLHLKENMFKIISTLIFILSLPTILFSQTDTYSEIYLMDFKRMNNLFSNDSSFSKSYFLRSSSIFFNNQGNFENNTLPKKYFRINNIGLDTRFNSQIGLSSNDGSFIPAVGLQQRLHFNLSFKIGKIHCYFAPELSKIQNKEPTEFVLSPQEPNYMARYYLYIVNKIDSYSQFGKDPFTTRSLGQTSIKYQTNNIAFGLSNENIWWGPGIRNSLVMSNNSKGFAHITLNTIKPLKTKFGLFEGQILFGNLSNSKFEHPDNQRMRRIWSGGIAPKDSSSRFINGFLLSFAPKLLPNLYIGIATSSSGYKRSGERKVVSFPFFSSSKPIKLGSLFLRYAMPKEKSELYFEFGRADKTATPFNLIKDSIPLGYTAGFRKFIPYSKFNSHFYFAFEMTRLELPDPRLIFSVGNVFGPPQTNSWYTSSQILQGYTNNAEVLGAWIGPGSNSQTLQFGWLRGLNKIQFTLERIQHNNDFYYYNYLTGDLRVNYQNPNKHWADIHATTQIQLNFKKLLFITSISNSSIYNYRWLKLDGGFSGQSKISDRRNTQLSSSLVYFFNKKGIL
jgi:hypothetical protein